MLSGIVNGNGGERMRPIVSLFTLLAVAGLMPAARAADKDFDGRWDLVVHKTPADKAWWLEVTSAGTPEIKGRFEGFPGGSLNDLPSPKIENGVLRFTWVDARNHLDYEIHYVNGVLEGQMTGGAEALKFTGHRAPVINEHDDGSWVKGKPITLFNGKDLTGWTGLKTGDAKGWTVV
jgi:hypothetical protein